MRSAADPKKIQIALERFKLGTEFRYKQKQRETEDLEFQVPEKQWFDDDRRNRGAQTINGIPVPARPMLSVAAVDEPIQLAANQERAAELGVHIHALTEDATDDTAEVLRGLYRNCEADSRAGNVRSWAYNRGLWCGWGMYRLDKVHDPDGGHWTDQKIIFRRLLYQGDVVVDPFATEPDWADGEWLFEPFMMRFSTFKRKYPKASMSGMTDAGLTDLNGDNPGWVGGDSEASRSVRLAKYWEVTIRTRTKVLLDDDTDAFDDEIPAGRTPKAGKDARSLEIEERTVTYSLINCQETLETQEWDGEYIPYIPVIGRELQPFDHERRWAGMMTNAKDGARLTNYAASGVVEMAALEPKAPWMGVEGVFEGHTEEFDQSNYRNIGRLQYRATGLNGQPAPPPTRVPVDMSRLGPNMQLLSMGKDFVQSSMATYGPALGQQTPAHRSGKAVEALQGQTIQANSNYLDNLAQISMMYESRVWLDLAPRVYDRPGRIAHIRDDAGKTSQVMLNQPHTIDPTTKQPVAVPPGQAPPQGAKYFDLSKGRYGVAVTIGKSSTSRLQEGSDALGLILQADPALIPLVGPEWMSFQDFPGAKAVASILKKNRDHAMPWLADGPPDAASQLAAMKAQMQKMGEAMQQMQQVIQTKQIENQGKLQVQALKSGADAQQAAADRETKLAVAELGAKTERDQMFLEERARLGVQGHEAGIAALDRAHETGMAAMDHSHDTQQADQGHQQALEQGQQAADLAPEPAAHDAPE